MNTGNSRITTNNPGSEPLISRRELAERWGCCVDTIRKRERMGTLHPIRFGPKMVRYKLSEALAIEAALSKGGKGQ